MTQPIKVVCPPISSSLVRPHSLLGDLKAIKFARSLVASIRLHSVVSTPAMKAASSSEFGLLAYRVGMELIFSFFLSFPSLSAPRAKGESPVMRCPLPQDLTCDLSYSRNDGVPSQSFCILPGKKYVFDAHFSPSSFPF